jgi:transcriptional regulator with XRE-family HTH domain
MSESGERGANVDGFGAELRRRRQRAFLTQESLAQLAGVDARTIRDIETRRTLRPRASTKRLLLDALPEEPPEHHQPGAVAPPEPPPVFPPAVTPFQLPADTAHFTGRSDPVNRLVDLWPRDPEHADDRDGGDRTRGTVVISAVDGMAGVGKTALAVHAAHRLAGRFEDGVLFIDLHGFTPGVEPISSEHALDSLLRGLGVPGDQIPPDLAARAALYRTVLAGRRVLIVLDNAADETQLQPLLPPTPGCGVLVTSRRRLAGLDDATHISLPTLPPREAAALFHALVANRADASDNHTIEQIVSRCGHLPVAIRIAAARLRTNPTSTPARLLAELTDALDNDHGLDWLSPTDTAPSPPRSRCPTATSPPTNNTPSDSSPSIPATTSSPTPSPPSPTPPPPTPNNSSTTYMPPT